MPCLPSVYCCCNVGVFPDGYSSTRYSQTCDRHRSLKSGTCPAFGRYLSKPRSPTALRVLGVSFDLYRCDKCCSSVYVRQPEPTQQLIDRQTLVHTCSRGAPNTGSSHPTPPCLCIPGTTFFVQEGEMEEWEPVDRDHVVKFFQAINQLSHQNMVRYVVFHVVCCT